MGRPKKDSKQITIHFPVDRTALPQRKKRPGQKPPPARHGPQTSSHKTGSTPRKPCISWKESVERRDASWEIRRPMSEERLMTSCIQVKEWDRMKHALILDHIQGRVKETLLRALKSHLCLQAVNNHCSECRWERQEDLRVAFIDLETRGFLNIPSYKCEMCGDVISVEPEDVGCFPATPVQPVTWFGHGLLRAVSFCKGPKKISVQGLIGMLDNGLDSGVNSGSESIVTLRPYLLSAAHSEFERVNKALAESVATNLPTNHDLNQHSQLAEQHTENGAA